jgi:hypothetical protein
VMAGFVSIWHEPYQLKQKDRSPPMSDPDPFEQLIANAAQVLSFVERRAERAQDELRLRTDQKARISHAIDILTSPRRRGQRNWTAAQRADQAAKLEEYMAAGKMARKNGHDGITPFDASAVEAVS